MKYKTGYQITDEGYFISEIQVRENPRKVGHFPCSENIIFTEPPKEKQYTIRQWTNKEWIYEDDYRGDWYNKKTGELKQITDIGEKVDLEIFTNEPPDGRYLYQYFNDITGVWEENLIEKERVEKTWKIAQIQSRLKELDIKKIRFLLEREKGDLSGKKYFDAYEEETLLLRNQLKELENESTMFA